MKKATNKENRMTAKPTIYFDLDGTLYDLYGQPNWLERITTLADPSVYAVEDAALCNLADLHKVLDTLILLGYSVGVVTWLAKNADPEYDRKVRKVKRAWVKKFLPQATEIHVVKYGTPKHNIINNRADAIIVDDNAEVREAWTRGITIDASRDFLPDLQALTRY